MLIWPAASCSLSLEQKLFHVFANLTKCLEVLSSQLIINTYIWKTPNTMDNHFQINWIWDHQGNTPTGDPMHMFPYWVN